MCRPRRPNAASSCYPPDMVAAWILTCMCLAPPAPATPATRPAAPAAPARADDRPFTHLFQHLGTDLRASVSRETGGILLVGAGAAGLAHAKDADLAAWVQRQPAAAYPHIGNAIGNGFVQGGGAVALWVLGRTAGNTELSHFGSDLIRAQVLNGVLTGTIKISARRERPNGGSESFPSGHTSSTFATAAMLQAHFGRLAGATGYAVASFVGWSRIRSNNHYASDVVFGAAVGVLSGRAVVRGRTGQWSVAPAATAGGFAVIVSRGGA